MVSLSGLVQINCDRLTLRKPSPSLQKQDVFSCFVRNPEAISYFDIPTTSWNPLSTSCVPNTLDVAQHVDLNAQALTSQISELRNEISIELDTIRSQITTLQDQVTTLQENVVSAIQQIGALQSQVTSQDARITALEGRVDGDEEQTSGLWAHIENIIATINFIGSMMSRIEEVLAALGIL
jgi:septal ring factor EnvC (AmiA/AmiB activator)